MNSTGTPLNPLAGTRSCGRATEHQAAGGIAHETGDLHRLLVESVDDYAIFALDQDGYILSWNAGAQRFKGYTADEVIGKHFSIFYPREKIDEGFPEFELREAARVGRFEDEDGASERWLALLGKRRHHCAVDPAKPRWLRQVTRDHRAASC